MGAGTPEKLSPPTPSSAEKLKALVMSGLSSAAGFLAPDPPATVDEASSSGGRDDDETGGDVPGGVSSGAVQSDVEAPVQM